MSRWHPIALSLIVAAVGVAACGSDDASSTTAVVQTTAAPAATTEGTTAVVQTTAAPAATTEGTTTAPPSYQDPPGGPGEEWAPEFIVEAITACTADASEEQCQCMLEEFQNRYAFDEFLAWAFEAADDDPRMIEVVDICAP